MIQISKSKKGNYQVANVASNGKLLKPSEPLSSKEKCWQNIRAEMSECFCITDEDHEIPVQDNTLKTVVFVSLKRKRTARKVQLEKAWEPK